MKHLIHPAQTLIDLPGVKLFTLDGRCEHWCKFMNQFESITEFMMRDPGQRPLCLAPYFRGSVREGIDGHRMLEPAQEYAKTKKFLRGLFERPLKFARNPINATLHETRLIKVDV